MAALVDAAERFFLQCGYSALLVSRGGIFINHLPVADEIILEIVYQRDGFIKHCFAFAAAHQKPLRAEHFGHLGQHGGEVDGKTYYFTAVSMGNPHAIIYVDDVDNLDLEKIGPSFENHVCFPDRVNTEFVQLIDRNTVKMRVWERGSGETLACGTGACAVAVSSILNDKVDGTKPVTVQLLGGNLNISWERDENLVYMTGPATTVFDGEIDLAFLDE